MAPFSNLPPIGRPSLRTWLAAFDAADHRALYLNVGAALITVLAMNGCIALLGWSSGPARSTALLPLPPGWLIGLVWCCLFVIMAGVRWRLNGLDHSDAATARRWLTGLIVFCLVYPLYTLGLRNPTIGLIGNITTALLAMVVIAKVIKINRASAAALTPLIIWLTYASLLI